jgi:hypothetical protein
LVGCSVHCCVLQSINKSPIYLVTKYSLCDISQSGGYVINAKKCFYTKILNFYLTFLNVKKNCIFDWNFRVEEKHCFFKKLLFQKTPFLINNIAPRVGWEHFQKESCHFSQLLCFPSISAYDSIVFWKRNEWIDWNLRNTNEVKPNRF